MARILGSSVVVFDDRYAACAFGRCARAGCSSGWWGRCRSHLAG